MDMTEETAFVGLTEGGAGGQLSDSADVVKERRSEQEVRAETRVQLRRLAAERRDPDRVLEQAAGVRVVCLGSRQAPQRRADRVVREETLHNGRETGMDDLGGEELEKAVQLFGVAPHCGREVGRVGLGRGLEGAHVDLEPVAELLDASEHSYRVAL